MSIQAATSVSIAIPGHSPELESRSRAIAASIARDAELARLFGLLDTYMTADRVLAHEIYPASRSIAGLFGLMQAHQRPQGEEAQSAMARIQCLVQMMKWALSRSMLSSHHFLTKSLACRSLATLYFPSVNATWNEMLENCLLNCLECLAVFEVNRQVDGALIPYLDDVVDDTTSIHVVVQNDFQIELSFVTRHLVSLYSPSWLQWLPIRTNDEHIWPIVYKWVAGEEIITLPSQLNLQRIDWKQIADHNSQIMKCWWMT